MFLEKDTPDLKVIPIKFFTAATYKEYVENTASDFTKNWLTKNSFKHKPGSYCIVPSFDGGIAEVLFALGDAPDAFWDCGALATKLPEGNYEFTEGLPESELFHASLAWALAGYKFSDFKNNSFVSPKLVLADSINVDSLKEFVSAIFQLRDLINSPANALGPEELAQEVVSVADKYDASFKQIVGDDLLKQNYPAIHTVGRASVRPPRLLELSWGLGNKFKLALVGKGVCFDTGGLDIKSTAGMRDMKKDMGGAAHALALARLIMAHELPIELRLYIPTVDNAISGNAYMPGDLISTRAGLSVEVDNTDAEGRLILADAITVALEHKPDMMLDFATLTGAARVALGPDLPGMFCNDDVMANAILKSAESSVDPIWRLPLFPAYRKFIESKLADVRSCGSCVYGGAITAALFLEMFVTEDIPWAHFDLMAANTRDLPGRPEGGEAMGIRSLFNYLSEKVAG